MKECTLALERGWYSLIAVFLFLGVWNRHIKAWIKGIEVLCVKLFLNGAESFTKSLEMHDFTCPEEFNGICDFRYIPDNAQNVVIRAPGFLFRSKVFVKVGDRIPLALEFAGVKGDASCRLRPDSNCVVNIIRTETGIFNFFHRKVSGKLMDNGRDHFQVCQLFRSNIVQHCRCHTVRHGKSL